MLALSSRVIYYISSGSGSAASSRDAARALRSCTLVCWAWALIARPYLQESTSSRIWSVMLRQLDSVGEHPHLSGPPTAYLVLHAARILLRNPLPKVPLGTSFSYVTFIELSSWLRGRVTITSVSSLRQTIASLKPLRNLELAYFTWADSGSYNSQYPVRSHSRARLHKIGICAERNWLLDIRSAHFITWLAQSGTAGELVSMHFEQMMLLEERLLAAVATIVDAAKGSLRRFFFSVGPNLAIHSRQYFYSLPSIYWFSFTFTKWYCLFRAVHCCTGFVQTYRITSRRSPILWSF